jgi:predicted DNA-binding protein with PD1-like motif
MACRSRGDAHAFRLEPGADLRAELVARTVQLKLEAAAIVTCVGSLQVACLRLADESIPKPYNGPFEIVSVMGTLGQGQCHLHLAIADATGRVIGGHMREGCIIHTTAEVVLISLVDLVFGRELDVGTGFKELSISTKGAMGVGP